MWERVRELKDGRAMVTVGREADATFHDSLSHSAMFCV